MIVRSDADNYYFSKLEILGRSPVSGDWKVVPVRRIIHPLPAHYFTMVAQNHFGLDPDHETELHVKKVGTWKLARFRHVTEEELQQTRSWLAGNLQRAGVEPNELLFRNLQIAVDRKTRNLEIMEVLSEEVVRLD